MVADNRRRTTMGAMLGILAAAALVPLVSAHEGHHHATAPADPGIPMGAMTTMHIVVQTIAWLFLFPLAMVMGLTRHRLHIPVAVAALALTSAGFVLGQYHGGRPYQRSAHSPMAGILFWLLIAQASLGTYLKLHLKWKLEERIRSKVVFVHGLIGKLFVVLGWVQMLLGVITLREWCRGGHTGQCLAHHIMGSAFIGYAIILTIMLKAGVDWLRRRNMSQEMLDSAVIFAWGCVNALTEHHGGPWTHKDLQHTLLGVVWACGGAAGMWTSRKGKRSVIPAVVIVITGWAMSGHAQALMISTMVHALFGYCLMAAGIARIIEVCFMLQDEPTRQEGDGNASRTASNAWFPVRAFQYLPIWLLFASGCVFMSATDEELRWADGLGIDSITWGLSDFSLSFLLFFWANVLVDLYVSEGGRYGSRDKNASHAQAGSMASAEAGLFSARTRPADYSRLSIGDSYAHSNEERTAVESSGADSGSSMEMNGLERSSRHSRFGKDGVRKGIDEKTDERDPPAHVLFGNDEGDEDADPFDDERLEREAERQA